MIKKEYKMLTVFEVADALWMHYNTIYRYVKAGKIQSVRIGGKYYIRQDELDRILREGVSLDLGFKS